MEWGRVGWTRQIEHSEGACVTEDLTGNGTMGNILFLCTGNYYRSRFAELSFNWNAHRRGLPYQAASRGLWLEPANPGPISRNTLRWLERLSIPSPESPRFPLELVEDDLRHAQLVIALKEAEHRPLMESFHPLWVNRIEYWHVDDMDCATPDEVIPQLHRQVEALLDRLETGRCQVPLMGATTGVG
ncbi:MAG: low molecular weight phosphatase family protein [Planctomycetaceae bacterium]|jgi:protein-tyrosine phosphatase